MFEIGGRKLDSRLFIGTGKYPDNSMFEKVAHSSGSQVVTVALRRLDMDNLRENMMDHIPKDMILLPNTSGARTAQEAVRIARLARAMGMGDWIKIEVINDTRYLLPDNLETLRAVEILAGEGFKVFPYMSPDLSMGVRMRDAGACAIMPLGSPIGSNRGIRTTELIRIMIEELKCPIVVDAGIGRPSQAAAAMEMGADAVLVNTAIASSNDPIIMGGAFRKAVEAGRAGYLAGLGASNKLRADASSPLTGFLGDL